MEAPLAVPDSNHSPSDEELMVRVQQGDAAAYHALFERHRSRLYGYLVRRTRDPQVAADLFQETFLRVHRSRHTWREGRPFRPWLYSIAVNASRDHGRRQRRLPDEVELGTGPVTHEHHVTRMNLEAAIGTLPETLRDAFLLGVVEGFDHNEVAAQLDITPANARARISRARAHLRKQLRGEQ